VNLPHAVKDGPDALHLVEPRHLPMLGAVLLGERERLHLIVDVDDGDVGAVAGHALTDAAGVDVPLRGVPGAGRNEQGNTDHCPTHDAPPHANPSVRCTARRAA
jgi:hypothetical protein